MRSSWVYILASRRNGTLYTGVTTNLEARIWQHRNDVFPGFARKYGCKRLVWFETHDVLDEAIQREKRIKRWKRARKLKLIETENADWRDLYGELIGLPDASLVSSSRPERSGEPGPSTETQHRILGPG